LIYIVIAESTTYGYQQFFASWVNKRWKSMGYLVRHQVTDWSACQDKAYNIRLELKNVKAAGRRNDDTDTISLAFD
jgi:hypothetical protein